MPPKKISKLFDSISFYYPKDGPNYAEVKGLINSHSGTVVDIPETANYHLLPDDWGRRYSEDENHKYYDVTMIDDWIKDGSIAVPDYYAVNMQFPLAPAVNERRKKERKRMRLAASESSNAVPATSPAVPMSPTRTSTAAAPVSPYPLGRVPSPVRPYTEIPISMSTSWFEIRGRTRFTQEDDFLIIRRINAEHKEVARRAQAKAAGKKVKYEVPVYSANGQQFWHKVVAEDLIPGKSWQALEGRYKKYIRGNYAKIEPFFMAWYRENPDSS